uniref:Sodium-coupled neutral amino acid transporter 7 n=1 Tax=Latimeria chalumnae TaxID=7897 RepID=H3AQM3_LATCH
HYKGSLNSEYLDYRWSEDAGERARLLQSPSMESGPEVIGKNGRVGTSAFSSVFIVVNAALGTRMLNFPAAFNTAGGVAAGIAVQMCLLVFIISCLVVLAYCSQVSNEGTYQEVMWDICRRVIGVLCEITITVYTFGTCIVFLIIIGDQLDKLIAAMAHEPEAAVSSHWCTDRKFTISLTSILVILSLSIPKEIGFQKYVSTLSVIGTWYVTVVIIITYLWTDPYMLYFQVKVSPSSWTAVLNAMPTICFGFQCHVISIPMFNKEKCIEINHSGALLLGEMKIALVILEKTGLECVDFLTLGDNVNQDVLLSYPSNDIVVAIACAFIIIYVLTSYPILHFCGSFLPACLWLKYQGDVVEVDKRCRVLQTVCWFTLTILALFFTDIRKVISLAACFIFVFPGM